MEFKSFFVMALLAGLFIFCLVSSSFYLSEQGGAEINILNDSRMNTMFGNVRDKLNTSNAEADAKREALVDETKNPVWTTLGFAFNSILSAGTTFMGMVIAIFGFTFVFAQEIFMINPIIMGTISAIIVGCLVLAFWGLIRSGR